MSSFDKLINGRPISPSIERGDLPFKLKNRQRVTEEQYFSLPESSDEGDQFFGKDVLNNYDDLIRRQELGLPKVFSDSSEKIFNESLEKSKDKLVKSINKLLANDDKRSLVSQIVSGTDENDGIIQFFTAAYDNQEIRDKYNQLLVVNKEFIPKSAEEMMFYFEEVANIIPPELYLEMIVAHRDRFNKLNLNLKEDLAEFYKSDLKTAFIKFGKENGLNEKDLELRYEELGKRLSIRFSDSAKFGDFSGILGSTRKDGHVIVSPYWGEKRAKKTFVHEIVHNLSGSTYRVVTDNVETEPELVKEEDAWAMVDGLFAIWREKSGLRIGENKRLDWLEEATTELVTIDLFETLDNELVSHSYIDERKLTNKILNNGNNNIPKDALYKAYFEGFNPNVPENEQLPNFKNLFALISKSYTPGFLIRLDSLIKSNGWRFGKPIIKDINANFNEISNILMQKIPSKEAILEVNTLIGSQKF